ncbi:MAG TPA: FtsX-like permease family protein [Firmicutes bacterium]|nr:FtsX-like permease family protein [Bacillota bacterium]
MRMQDIVFVAWRNIRMRWFESLLIVLAVGVGAGVLGGVISLALTAYLQVAGIYEKPQFRSLEVRPAVAAGTMFNDDRPAVPLSTAAATAETPAFSWNDILAAKEAISGISQAYVEEERGYYLEDAPLPSPPAVGSSGGGSAAALRERMLLQEQYMVWVVLTTADYMAAYDLALQHGSPITDDDVRAARPVAVIGEKLAARLFGEADPLGKEIKLQNNLTLQVIGVMAKDPRSVTQIQRGPFSADEFVLVPLTAIGDGRVDSFQLLPAAHADIAKVTAALRAYVQTRWGAAVAVWSNYEQFRFQWAEALKVALIFGIFSSMALWIAAINILNLMLARVLRRSRTLGLALALGATRRILFRQSLAEALLLGGAGGVLGVALSAGVVALFTAMTQGALQALPWTFSGAFATALVVGLLFGIYPAMQAARVQPAAALRLE